MYNPNPNTPPPDFTSSPDGTAGEVTGRAEEAGQAGWQYLP